MRHRRRREARQFQVRRVGCRGVRCQVVDGEALAGDGRPFQHVAEIDRLGRLVAVEDKEALEWSRTVRLPVVVCGLLEALGSLAVKEIAVIPNVVEVAETVHGSSSEQRCQRLICPSVALPLDYCAETV